MAAGASHSSASAGAQTAIARVPAPTFAAQKLAVLVGLALVVAGSLGFVASSSFDTRGAIDRGSLLGFDVNGWSNLLHLAAGLLLLAVAANRRATRAAWRLIALAALLALVAGLIDGDDVFGLAPVNPLDHVGDAVILLIAIIGSRTAKEDRGILERDRLVFEDGEGPRIVGPGSGHVGGPRRHQARIDARL